MVVGAYPGHRPVGRQPVQDGERGERRTGATDPAPAGHLHPLPVVRPAQRLVERVQSVGPLADNISSAAWWHPAVRYNGKGVFGSSGTRRFFDKQGAVHARVSVDFPREFGCLLEAPIADEV